MRMPLQSVGVTYTAQESNGMEVDGAQQGPAGGKRKLHFGQMGLNYWRENTEVTAIAAQRKALECPNQ